MGYVSAAVGFGSDFLPDPTATRVYPRGEFVSSPHPVIDFRRDNMLKNLFIMFGYLFAGLFGFFLVYTTIRSLCIFFVSWRRCRKRKHSFKFIWKCFLRGVREHRYIKPVDFVKWVAIDLFRGKDNLRLYGIWAFTGYYGQGKTLGCVQFANQLKENYPHRDIKIFSNIYVKGQERRIMNWEELLDLPPNSIFIFDESQADFSCNNREFPDDLLRKITQCRKRRLAMFMTSPRFNRMNINIRESVNFIIDCKNIFNLDRWFKYIFYRAEDYEQHQENKLKLLQSRYLVLDFVTNDRDYQKYNTVEEVSTIKGEEIKATKKNVIQLESHFKKFRNDILKEIEVKYLPALQKK